MHSSVSGGGRQKEDWQLRKQFVMLLLVNSAQVYESDITSIGHEFNMVDEH